jgi:hypothetical protein
LYKADFIIISLKINFFSPITYSLLQCLWLISLYLFHFTNMINLPLFITFYKYDLTPFIYFIFQIWFISLYLLHFTNMIYLPLFISFYKYDLSPFIYYILQYYLSPLMYYILHLLSPFLYHNTYDLSPFIYLRNIWNCWTGYAI